MENLLVFIVDDDEIYSAMLRHQLSKIDGVKIKEYTYVERAIANLNLMPDLILLDHELNGVDGTDAIPTIKEAAPKTCLAILTGHKDLQIFADAMQRGADFFFKKNDSVLVNLSTLINSKKKQKEEESGFFQSLFKKFKSNPTEDVEIQTVFVVEDDDLFSFAIRYRLEKSPNLNIKTFRGTKMLQALEEEPDLVILDYQLEDVKGDALCREIKQFSPHTKVIMLSSQQELDTAMHMFDIGVDKYIIKNAEWTQHLESALQEYHI